MTNWGVDLFMVLCPHMFISIVTGLTVFIQEISNQTILSVTSQSKTSKYMELWFIVLTGTCSADQLWFPDVLAWTPEKRSFSQVQLLNVASTSLGFQAAAAILMPEGLMSQMKHWVTIDVTFIFQLFWHCVIHPMSVTEAKIALKQFNWRAAW